MEYFERIRALREDADFSQTKVATYLGTDQSYYSKQERGEKPFQIKQIIAICEFYQVSADYILGLPKGLKWPR